MLKKINLLIDELKLNLENVSGLEELKQIKAEYTSKSEFFISLKSGIREAEDKQLYGSFIKAYSEGVNLLLSNKKEELANSFFLEKRENPIINGAPRIILDKKNGTIHPITLITKQVIAFFDNLNFKYTHGIEVEIEKYNFDILNLGANHPAREMQDTFYLEGGKLLRTHATNMSARELETSTTDSFRSYSVGSVFRNDENDATHSFQFNQIDIFNNGSDMNISNLKWTLNELMNHLFEKDLKTRYRPSYFPFTEPSYEVDVQCPHCKGDKCKICSHSGWIEVLGSGMLSPVVFKNAGKDPENLQGWAAGIGVERLAMMKWPITDIRDMYRNDIDFLNKFKNGEK